MHCKELRRHLLDTAHPEARTTLRDALREKVAKIPRTFIREAYPAHFW